MYCNTNLHLVEVRVALRAVDENLRVQIALYFQLPRAEANAKVACDQACSDLVARAQRGENVKQRARSGVLAAERRQRVGSKGVRLFAGRSDGEGNARAFGTN